jgi:two-component system response regulator MprA
MRRVLVVEDDPRLAAFLDHALVRAGYCVELVTASPGAIKEARAHAYDLVLVSSAATQLELTRQLRAETAAPILLLGASERVEDRVAALDAGADDMLGQPFALPELLARLRALRRGRALALAQARGEIRRGQLQYADVQLDQDTREATRGGRPLVLRHLTFELLAYLLRHPERVISRQELLERVWDYPQPAVDAGFNVVDVTVSRLRHALEAGGEPRLIHTVRPIGYMLRAPRGAR